MFIRDTGLQNNDSSVLIILEYNIYLRKNIVIR